MDRFSRILCRLHIVYVHYLAHTASSTTAAFANSHLPQPFSGKSATVTYAANMGAIAPMATMWCVVRCAAQMVV